MRTVPPAERRGGRDVRPVLPGPDPGGEEIRYLERTVGAGAGCQLTLRRVLVSRLVAFRLHPRAGWADHEREDKQDDEEQQHDPDDGKAHAGWMLRLAPRSQPLAGHVGLAPHRTVFSSLLYDCRAGRTVQEASILLEP